MDSSVDGLEYIFTNIILHLIYTRVQENYAEFWPKLGATYIIKNNIHRTVPFSVM